MEGSSSRTPEITIVPAPRPAAGGGAVDAVKAASKEPISPGSPSPASAAGRGKEKQGAVSVPGWKLDSLCRESGSPPAMMGRFPYF